MNIRNDDSHQPLGLFNLSGVPEELKGEVVASLLYLRTRNRWTPELESELVFQTIAENKVPNVFEFGVTKETQDSLMASVKSILAERGIFI